MVPMGLPMKGLRRNDDAMKNCCWLKNHFQPAYKTYYLYTNNIT